MTKNEEITAFMLTSLKDQGFEDTTENRLAFLEGLRDGWKEDKEENTDVALEKVLYQVTLTGMISILKVKLQFAR